MYNVSKYLRIKKSVNNERKNIFLKKLVNSFCVLKRAVSKTYKKIRQNKNWRRQQQKKKINFIFRYFLVDKFFGIWVQDDKLYTIIFCAWKLGHIMFVSVKASALFSYWILASGSKLSWNEQWCLVNEMCLIF